MVGQSRWKCLNLQPNESPASWIASRPELRQQLLGNLTDPEAKALEYDWDFWARRNQIEPEGSWRKWLVLAGRGFGKTRTGAEIVRGWAESGRYSHIALVAPTAGDIRRVMVEGESGILAISPPWFKPQWLPTRNKLVWPNGATASAYSADEPERLRGPQQAAAWCDEMVAWRYQQAAWDMLMFGLRLGDDPRVVITTTPKPQKLLKEIMREPGTVVTRGSTYENRGNLAPGFFADIIKKYEGTRLGRQELLAEILEDVEGALWSLVRLDANRRSEHPDLYRVVVGVDPAGGHRKDSDETGIIVAGAGVDGHGYTLADASCKLSPEGWGRRVVNAFWRHQADCVVAEGNFGGEMVTHVINTIDPRVPVKLVHASRGKQIRAEPIAAMDEQGRDHHVGSFPALEEQMCNFVPGNYDGSPDRMDAKVWAYTELFLEERPQMVLYDEPMRISAY